MDYKEISSIVDTINNNESLNEDSIIYKPDLVDCSSFDTIRLVDFANDSNLGALYKCVSSDNIRDLYRRNLYECSLLYNSHYINEIWKLPGCRYMLPSGYPLYNAFNVDCRFNARGPRFEYDVFYPYDIDVFKTRNDIFFEYKSDILMYNSCKNKLLYDYESNFLFVDEMVGSWPFEFLITETNFFFCQLIRFDDNKYMMIYCTDSKKEAYDKGMIFRRYKYERYD